MRALSITVTTRETEDGQLVIETSVKTDRAGAENYIKFAEVVDPRDPSPRRVNGPTMAPILYNAIGQINRINATMLMHDAGRAGEEFLDPDLLWGIS